MKRDNAHGHRRGLTRTAAFSALVALFVAWQALAAESPVLNAAAPIAPRPTTPEPTAPEPIAAAAPSTVLNATVEQPRAFGYVIGDLATQRVLLDQQGFTPPDTLPAAGPLGNWLERHAVHVEADARGRRWLVVEYQIMNSPQSLTAVTLPAWRLKSKGSNAELLVPQWQISVGPLTPREAFTQPGLGGLRPDRAAPLIDLAPLQRWINVWVTAAIVLLLAWAGWWVWRNWQASARQPFARALRELRDIDEQSPEAWYAVHRALDATAGRVVQKETAGALFARAPQFAPERAAIERFLDASMARFFGGPARSGAGAAHSRAAVEGRFASNRSGESPLISVRALCTALRRIEKRHET